ncbi:MAG: ribosome silencing factor [Clostridiales bacterium]|jgi:ribosome-associated protein|nr:ribosome silencing factor [Clostridiales bacterium]
MPRQAAIASKIWFVLFFYGILNKKEMGLWYLELKEQVLQLCEILHDKKAQDIIAIHVADKTVIADWFIVCSGRVPQQVKALCDEVEEKAPALGLEYRRREGYSQGRWVVLDYRDILLHIFLPEERRYYNMERLWVDDPGGYIRYPQP